MLGSTVLEVGIGMALLFLFASLIATAAQEVIEGVLQKRGKDLERGIKELLADANGAGLTAEFYRHPLISSLYPGEYLAASRTLPSYIPTASFALALMDLAREKGAAGANSPSTTLEAVEAGAKLLGNDKVRRMIAAAIQTGGGDVERVRKTLESAFDATMDRVSGWYRRRTQWVIGGIGLATAVGLNIDAITVAQRLSEDGSLRRSVVSAAAAAPQAGSRASIEQLRRTFDDIGYPIGWATPAGPALLPVPAPQACKPNAFPREGCDYEMTSWKWLRTGVGWLVTTLAIMLGAPFWFDVLNKFMVIRSTVKPNEKSMPEGSEDRQAGTPPRLRIEVATTANGTSAKAGALGQQAG